MNSKKKLSVNLIKTIEPTLKEYFSLIKIIPKEGFELYLSDIDETSNIYFGIIKETYDSNGHYIHCAWKPQSSSNKNSGSTSYKIENFIHHFKIWLANLEYYHRPSILDDPILLGYQDEFFQEFRIVDEDADFTPFNYDQQLSIVRFLDNIIQNIDEVKDENNKETISEIKNDAKDLQETITQETKNSFMKKLGLLIAKARKAGFKTSNFVFKEFVKEFIKEGAKWAFNFAMKNSDQIPEYIRNITDSIRSLN